MEREGSSRDDLAAREADLERREREAAAAPGDQARHDALADERDGLAEEWDEVADGRDDAAGTRRGKALERDVEASGRDQLARTTSDDQDAGFADRFLSARDVDDASGDRADARDDAADSGRDRARSARSRVRAADDRKAASHAAGEAARREETALAGLETRTVIGQATGLIMAKLKIGADEAFQVLVAESQARNVKLRDVAAEYIEKNS